MASADLRPWRSVCWSIVARIRCRRCRPPRPCARPSRRAPCSTRPGPPGSAGGRRTSRFRISKPSRPSPIAISRPKSEMLVFGDRDQPVAPRRLLHAVTACLRSAETSPPGADRHDQLTRAFIDAAGLLQGLADAEFAARGHDDLSATQEAAMALLVKLARKLAASAWSGYAATGPGVAPELVALALQPLPESV